MPRLQTTQGMGLHADAHSKLHTWTASTRCVDTQPRHAAGGQVLLQRASVDCAVLTPSLRHCVQNLVASGQLCEGARLLVTGHSLGGALATLAAFDIKQAMAHFRVQLYTFGTPYPGNRAFSREFNGLLPDTWHVIHDGVSWRLSLHCSTKAAVLQ